MAIFDRFKRKQKVVLPEEVNEYYQSQRRERVSVAIILGVVALVVTLLIAAGLFFGGRFLYRKISGTEVKKPATVQVEEKKTSEEGSSSADNQNGGRVDAPANPAPSSPAPTPAPTTSTPAPAQTPALGDTPALPRTGDEGM